MLFSAGATTGYFDPFGSVTIDLATTVSIGSFRVPSTIPLLVPIDPGLVGTEFYFQAVARTMNGSWRMSGRVDVVM